MKERIIHRTLFYEKVKRGGTTFLMFTVPFYVVTAKGDTGNLGGQNYLQPVNCLEFTSFNASAGLKMNTVIHEIREYDVHHLLIDNSRENPLTLHGFCLWPVR